MTIKRTDNVGSMVEDLDGAVDSSSRWDSSEGKGRIEESSGHYLRCKNVYAMRLVRSATITLLGISLTATIACKTEEHVAPERKPPAPQAKLLIQPYKGISASDVEVVRRGIDEIYRFEIKVLPEKDLPASAFYEPRKRYHAAALLEDLYGHGDEASRVIGLTSEDISVLRGENEDWGIFGFGMIGGKPCVVSGYRLRRGGAGRALYEARLKKVANHEIGHTLGLDHCDKEACLMRDAGGKISTIDNTTGTFCERCKAKLAPLSVLRQL